MKKVILTVLVTTSLLLTACSGTPDKTTSLASDDSGKICKMETITGSKIVHKVCRSPAQIEYDRQLAYNTIKQAVRGAVSTDAN